MTKREQKLLLNVIRTREAYDKAHAAMVEAERAAGQKVLGCLVKKHAGGGRGAHVSIDLDRAKKLRAAGHSINQISKMLGCSYTGVHRLLC